MTRGLSQIEIGLGATHLCGAAPISQVTSDYRWIARSSVSTYAKF
jgi:hypothetical protein